MSFGLLRHDFPCRVGNGTQTKRKKKRRDGEKMPHRRGVYSELATVVVVVTQSRENQNPKNQNQLWNATTMTKN